MENLKEEIEALIKSRGAVLYDMEIVREGGKTIFRVYIDRGGGVTIDLCAAISRIISPLLDVKPPIDGEYLLEVSSRGLNRRLKTAEHFGGAIGEKIKITLKSGAKIKGRLLSAEDKIVVEGHEAVGFNEVAKANVVF
ncbi:MAG: ribosome maturation factor [Helicobacteraceae bacterium]|jgi:ribosome maturation factor RimP|nr:ribosome maturation factor [Helicobacteraceae bacterium]